MKALVTGCGGFVGPYLCTTLLQHGYAVIGLDVMAGEHVNIIGDITDAGTIASILAKEQPDVLFHLAGQASVANSWIIPQKTVELNVIGTLNLMEAILKFCPQSKLVLIGSSDEYGRLGERGQLVDETQPLLPETPYAVSKQSQETLAQIYVRSKGMNICMTRSFNHSGAGQKPGFMISDFASGIVRIERGLASELAVGNLDSYRDFTHVKDVAAAYFLLGERGVAGEVYNVGSGVAYQGSDILERLISMAACPIKVVQDAGKLRPSDTPIIRCDNSKLCIQTGWVPRYTVEEMLLDTLNHFRRMVE